MAAKLANVTPPRFAFPKPLLVVITTLTEAFCKLTGFESVLTNNSVKLMYQTWPMSHQKAVSDLGWKPRPIKDAIKDAVNFYRQG